MEKVIQVIQVEDDRKFAKSVQSFLSDLNCCRLLGQYQSVEDALMQKNTKVADILLLDINLPGKDGLQGIPEFRKVNHDLEIIMISGFNDNERLFKSLQLGARGYLLKSDCFIHLDHAIQEVMLGGMLFSPEMAQRVLQYFRKKPLAKVKLTKREKDVLRLIKAGFTKMKIATELNISYGTVDTHVKHIYKKLDVNSSSQAADSIEDL